jgi:hypothetical protein
VFTKLNQSLKVWPFRLCNHRLIAHGFDSFDCPFQPDLTSIKYVVDLIQVTGWYVWMAKPIISNSGKTAGDLFHFLTPINVKWYPSFGLPQKIIPFYIKHPYHPTYFTRR